MTMGATPNDVNAWRSRVGYPTMKERCDGRIWRMVVDGIVGALGEGWLGKLVVGGICAAGAWFARRPAEKAVLLDAVNRRVESLLAHLEGEIARLKQDLKDERVRCDAELTDMQAQIDKLMGGPIAPYGAKP